MTTAYLTWSPVFDNSASRRKNAPTRIVNAMVDYNIAYVTLHYGEW